MRGIVSVSALAGGVLLILGVLWGLWHLPVIDFLGAGTLHRSWWLAFAVAFIAAMTAMRVLICWLYANTKSVLLAQLLHISSTGSLVISAPGLTPALRKRFGTAFTPALSGSPLHSSPDSSPPA